MTSPPPGSRVTVWGGCAALSPASSVNAARSASRTSVAGSSGRSSTIGILVLIMGNIMHIKGVGGSTPPEMRHSTTPFIERLGREVRRRRLAADLTVQALADRAGLSRRLLTQIE